MKITKSQKKFIKSNINKLTLDEISKYTGLPQKGLQRFQKLKRSDAPNLIQINSIKTLAGFMINNLHIIFVLITLVFVIYFNSLGGQFVSDDIPSIKDFESINSVFAAVKTAKIQRVIYAVSYSIFKTNPTPLHLVSVTLHSAAVILLFILISLTFGKKIGILSSFLFASHPINTEAVSWISGINYVINALFFLCTSLTFIFYKNSRKKVYFFVSLIFYILSFLLTRITWALTIFPLLFVVDFFLVEKRADLGKMKLHIPFAVCSLIFIFFLFSSMSSRLGYLDDEAGFIRQGSARFSQRVPYTIFSSLKLLSFPKYLTIYHSGEKLSREGLMFMSLITLLFFALIPYVWKKNRKIAGLMLIFLFSILPTLSPIQVAWFVADRYLYIGSMALSIFIAHVALSLEQKTGIKRLSIYICVFLTLLYSTKTVIRNNDWQTPKNLWLATAKVSPNDMTVHNNLGDIYASEGNFEKSVGEFKRAIQIEPTYSFAIHNLGNTYLQMGKLEEAETEFKKAFKLNPRLYQSLFKLGVIEYNRKNPEKAKEYFGEALKINPDYEDAKTALRIVDQEK